MMDYKVHSPSPISLSSNSSSPSHNNSLQFPSDDQLRKEGIDSIILRLRFAQNEHSKLLIERSHSTRDANKKLQVQLLETQGVRDVNQRLMHEKENLIKNKEELAGICYFLDDDREKAKCVAREWQMFGRYCTGVLQKELSMCQNQIEELEHKQAILAQENKNLKELCILLDHEQAGSRNSVGSQSSLPCQQNGLSAVAALRDLGDGSSNGSTASNYSPDNTQASSFAKENLHSTSPSHGETYLRYLEHKVRHLEEESKARLKPVSVVPSTSVNSLSLIPPNQTLDSSGKSEKKCFTSSILPTKSQSNESNLYYGGTQPSVLKVRGQLDQPTLLQHVHASQSGLDNKEEAVIKEIAWTKLGGKPKKINGKLVVPRTASVSNL